MNLQSRLLEDMKSAMKSGDKVRLETVRLLRAQMKDA
ncbi:MAG: GatB/YqeY domain-containing protein, partial [candidate division KSB1 bacterium]|nr:GatB/YqeY domain-containing protein [candidate division KSB1 bacterium]